MTYALRMAVALSAVLWVSGCAMFSPPPAPPPAPVQADPWAAWQQHFAATMDACAQAKGSDCLAKAYNANPRPPEDNPLHTVSGDLTYDLRIAQAMLADADAVTALNDQYSIWNVGYLGTGFSVPTQGSAVEPYWRALQREFFLPNFCAQAIAPACAAADPDLWTWQFSVAQYTAALDQPIAQLLHTKPVQGDLKLFWKRTANGVPPRADGLPIANIRFALLKPSWNTGQVGKSTGKLVFFSSYDEVRDKTLREALTDTGSASLAAGAEPGMLLFVYIYAPGADTKAQVASWHAVYRALEAESGP